MKRAKSHSKSPREVVSRKRRKHRRGLSPAKQRDGSSDEEDHTDGSASNGSDTEECRRVEEPAVDHLARLSMEILCQILDYLPLRDIMRTERTCLRMRDAVSMHLRLIVAVDFADVSIYDYMPVVRTYIDLFTLVHLQ